MKLFEHLLDCLKITGLVALNTFGIAFMSLGLSQYFYTVKGSRRQRGVLPINSHMRYRSFPDGTFMRATVIRRSDDEDYLRRFIFLKTRRFSIYLHKILADDDICLHDHPWSFISVMLWGKYREMRRTCWLFDYEEKESEEERSAPSVAYRPYPSPHRISLIDNKPCYTLVFTGSKVRDWGFYTKKGWIHQKKYNHERDCV